MPRIRAVLVLGALLLSACASYDGRGLQPGVAGRDEVRGLMGEPTAVRRVAGVETWEYFRGPEGFHTFMVRFRPDGRVAAIEQVYDRRFFDTVQPGMTGEEVEGILGRPFRMTPFTSRNELVWDYRWTDSPFEHLRFFHVVFDVGSARVKGTLHTIERFPSGADSHP